MISSLCWVPRGVAKPVPVEEAVDEEELAAMQAEYGELAAGAEPEVDEDDEPSDSDEDEESDGPDDEVARARSVAAALKSNQPSGSSKRGSAKAADVISNAMKELDMDNYDEDDGEEENIIQRVLGGGQGADIMEDDPYVTLQDEDNSEQGDVEIRPDDLLILAAKTEDDVSTLEVWLYEEDNIYVHHDLILPAFPLSLAWLDCDPTGQRQAANLVAVGTMLPGIEIWDLDVLNSVTPLASLGGEEPQQPSSSGAEGGADDGEGEASGSVSRNKKKKLKAKEKKKRKQAAATLRPGSHEGAVLSLCWNREYRNVLASGSADTTVKVWDVSKQACEHTLTHHAGKVQCVAWNPAEAPVLLTGGFDRQAALADVRSPSGKPLSWATKADVEALAWVPHDPTCFLVSTEDGLVTCFDARKGDAALYRLAAHDQAACALSFCPGAPGLLATASTDKQVKLWDVLSHKPSLIAAQDLKVGSVFAAGFCASAPYLLAAAGSKGEVSVWNVAASSAVAARYPALAEMAGAAAGAARGEEGEGSDSES